MIPSLPVLGIRLDIDKLDSGAYGVAAWKVLWRAIIPSRLTGSLLFEGDTSATLQGAENVFVIAIQNVDEDVLSEVRAALESDPVFATVAGRPRFVVSTAAYEEPLVDAGRVEANGELSGKIYNSGPAWDEVSSESASRTSAEETTAVDVPERTSPASERTAELPTLDSLDAVLGLLLDRFGEVNRYQFWLTPEELCDIVTCYSDLLKVTWEVESSGLSRRTTYVTLFDASGGSRNVTLFGLFAFTSEGAARDFCNSRSENLDYMIGQLEERFGLDGAVVTNFSGKSFSNAAAFNEAAAVDPPELWARICERRVELGVEPSVENADHETMDMAVALQVVDESYLAGGSVETLERSEAEVRAALDSIVSVGDEGVMFLVDALWRGMNVVASTLHHEIWGDYTWNIWLQKREIVRALERAGSSAPVETLRSLAGADSNDPQFYELFLPAARQALETLTEVREPVPRQDVSEDLPRINGDYLPKEFEPYEEEGGPGGHLQQQGVQAWNGGDKESAAELWRAALEEGLTPTHEASVLKGLGEIHLGRGDLEAGAHFLLRALATRPITVGVAHDAAVRLEIVYGALGRTDESAALGQVARATATPGVELAHSYVVELRELAQRATSESEEQPLVPLAAPRSPAAPSVPSGIPQSRSESPAVGRRVLLLASGIAVLLAIVIGSIAVGGGGSDDRTVLRAEDVQAPAPVETEAPPEPAGTEVSAPSETTAPAAGSALLIENARTFITEKNCQARIVFEWDFDPASAPPEGSEVTILVVDPEEREWVETSRSTERGARLEYRDQIRDGGGAWTARIFSIDGELVHDVSILASWEGPCP